jgi:glycosyltransferase involved in cell wall biosynthesis
LVHPSFHDTAGLACLEAMARGKPVLCLAAGGPAALIDAGSGIAVEPRGRNETVRGLAEAMRALALDPERRRGMGRAAAERADRLFRWERKAERIAREYRQIVKGDGER